MKNWTPRPPHPDEPICWTWPVPPLRDRDEEIERYMDLQRGLPIDHTLSRDALEMTMYDMSAMRLAEFQTGQRMTPGVYRATRCAICPRNMYDIVEDHCHDVGQVRGYLCRSCNIREGRSNAPIFIRYRRIHPAAILDHYEMYTGMGWTDGWSWYTHGAESQSGKVRQSTPWPAWTPDIPLDQGRPPVVVQRRPGDADHEVLTVEGGLAGYRKGLCDTCPWAKDQAGRFPPEVFLLAARTAYDRSEHEFACHEAGADRPLLCAGYLLRGADHNLRTRLAVLAGDVDLERVRDGGRVLWSSYRAMAVGNGCDPEVPELRECRP